MIPYKYSNQNNYFRNSLRKYDLLTTFSRKKQQILKLCSLVALKQQFHFVCDVNCLDSHYVRLFRHITLPDFQNSKSAIPNIF